MAAGPNLVTPRMNGWAEGEPAWWLNLQAQPEVQVDLADRPRLVTGPAARGEERERLWQPWRPTLWKTTTDSALCG